MQKNHLIEEIQAYDKSIKEFDKSRLQTDNTILS